MDLVWSNDKTKIQIDYILSRHKYTIENVHLLNTFNTGSNHSLVRINIKINGGLKGKNKIYKCKQQTNYRHEHTEMKQK